MTRYTREAWGLRLDAGPDVQDPVDCSAPPSSTPSEGLEDGPGGTSPSTSRPARVDAREILKQAAEQVFERGHLRDSGGERSIARAVEAFNALTDHELTETDGWLFMICLKAARARGGQRHMDDYIDLVGYAALLAESAGENE